MDNKSNIINFKQLSLLSSNLLMTIATTEKRYTNNWL